MSSGAYTVCRELRGGRFVVQDLLDSEDGWLCPACDCRYDILWALAQTLDLEFEQLTEQRCAATCQQLWCNSALLAVMCLLGFCPRLHALLHTVPGVGGLFGQRWY